MDAADQNGGSNQLVVNTVGGSDDVWSSSEVGNLTYCVSDDFGSLKSTVVNAMAGGASLWEGSSSAIDFVYDSSQDANCTTSNDAVLFSVEPIETDEYIARSFFPSSGDFERNILVDDSLTTSGWAPSNILGHELGHTLGFRHEHTRPEAGTCFEDNNWRPLTPYDSASIMHYPQCNGSSPDLSFSSLDASGCRLDLRLLTARPLTIRLRSGVVFPTAPPQTNRRSGDAGGLVQLLEQVVGGELDRLVPPLRGAVDAGDQPGAVHPAEVAVDERVAGLGLVVGALGQAEVPGGVLLPRVPLEVGRAGRGVGLDVAPVGVEDVLLAVDQLPAARDRRRR